MWISPIAALSLEQEQRWLTAPYQGDGAARSTSKKWTVYDRIPVYCKAAARSGPVPIPARQSCWTQTNLQLGVLLSVLQSLKKLDITSCRHVKVTPIEYPLLRLHSFACHYCQLRQVEDRPFTTFSQAFQTREGITVTPTLRVKAKCSVVAYQHWDEHAAPDCYNSPDSL